MNCVSPDPEGGVAPDAEVVGADNHPHIFYGTETKTIKFDSTPHHSSNFLTARTIVGRSVRR